MAKDKKSTDLKGLKKGKQLYEGKAKKVFATTQKDVFLQTFKDDATAFNAKKKGTITDKGRMNAAISAALFEMLEKKGVPTHYLGLKDDITMAVRGVEIVKVEVVMRNIVAGSLQKRTGLAEGTVLDRPIFETYYKDDELGDPMINPDHIRALGLASGGEMKTIEKLARHINKLLVKYMAKRGLQLVDFKLEFGRPHDKGENEGGLILADEISPDTCRLWDAATHEKLDKDRFRFDLGKVEEGYQQVYQRVTGEKP